MLGGFVGIELRDPAKRKTEVQRGLGIGNYFKSLGGKYLIAADGGDKSRVQLAGCVGAEDGLSDLQWDSLCAGLNELGHLHIKDMDEQLLRTSREAGWSFYNALKKFIFCIQKPNGWEWKALLGGDLSASSRGWSRRKRSEKIDS